MGKYVVFKEKTVICATIVEAEDEIEAYELCDEDLETDNSIKWSQISVQDENLLDDEPEELDMNNQEHIKILEMINSEPEVVS